MMRKIGIFAIGGFDHAFPPYSPHTQLCTLLQQNRIIQQSLSLSVCLSEHLAHLKQQTLT